jgi:integrase
MRTKNGLPKGCVWNLDRENGKRRVRYRDRKTGFSVYLYGTPWSPEFMQAYAAAVDGGKARLEIVGDKRTVAGSISALIVSYFTSPDSGFKELRALTQRDRRSMLESFRAEYGDLPVKGLTRGIIAKIIKARSNAPHAANNLLKVLRYLLDHAIAEHMIEHNPAIGVKKHRVKSDGWHTWTEAEVTQFLARHPLRSRAGLALALLLHTGQRRGDVVRMGWQHITDDLIAVRQQKTDKPLMIPMHPELIEALDALPKTNMTFLITERGAPFTSDGFGNWFRDCCDEAGLPQCSAHGLRKLAATRLANAGCTNEQIKAITGHRSDASLAPYVRAADQKRLARQAMAKLIEGGGEARTEMVQQPIHAGPKEGKQQ